MRAETLKHTSIPIGRILQGIRLLLLFAITTASSVSPASNAGTFTATLLPETVAVGDNATLQLVFTGSGQIQLTPLPNLPGLLVSEPEQSRSVNIVNGQKTETFSVTYYLRPTQTNVFHIPSLTARIGNEELRSQPLQLTAVNTTQGEPSQALAVLRLVVPRNQVYLGETIVVELQLLLRGNASNPAEFKMPDFSGPGWLAGQPMQAQRRQAQYGGQVVSVWPIQIPLTPLKTGKLLLGPVESSVVVQLPSQRRRNDPFSGIGFGLFQQTEPHRVPLSLPAHQLEVLPLPAEGVPANFSGAIGQFDMSVSAGPTNVTVGDPITVRVQISGQGNMSSITLPNPLVQGDFKTYEPESKLDTTDDYGLAGVKTVEQIVIPENTEIHELPPIEFSFFNPKTQAYRTLIHPPTPLEVMPAGSRPTPVVALGNEAQQAETPRQDIVHIKQRPGSPQPTGTEQNLVGRLLAWNAVPVAAWLGMMMWRKRRDALDQDPRLRRQQQVRRAVEQGLIDLRTHAETGSSDAFFAVVFRLLQEQLGLVLDQPASGITESVVEEKLDSLSASGSLVTTLHELFQACNQARYAPTRDKQELAAWLPKLEAALRELQEVRS
jgi:hypothetical protein